MKQQLDRTSPEYATAVKLIEAMNHKLKELLASLLIGILFSIAIISYAEHEDQLLNKHRGHLTGYEYGAYQASIY